MEDWMISHDLPALATVEACLDGVLSDGDRGSGAVYPLPTYAARLGELALTERTWSALLGGPDVRIDVIAIPGNYAGTDLADLAYTYHLPGVGAARRLPIEGSGYLMYLGQPAYFLSFAVIASRYRSDAGDLSHLLRQSSIQTLLEEPLGRVRDLTPRDPITAHKALIGAQRAINVALQVVRTASSASVGLFQDSKLEFPDMFGCGRNPATGSYQRSGLSLWYEVVEAGPTDHGGLQPRLVVAMDVVNYSGRSEPAMHNVQTRLDSLVAEVLTDLPEQLLRVPRQNVGDSVTIVPHNSIRDYSRFLPALIKAVRQRLAANNGAHRDRIRLRISMEIGMVRAAPLGFSGDAIVTAHRLLGSEPIRRAMIDNLGADLAVIVSQYIYNNVVVHGYVGLDPTVFSEVAVTEKTFSAPAWLWTPPNN